MFNIRKKTSNIFNNICIHVKCTKTLEEVNETIIDKLYDNIFDLEHDINCATILSIELLSIISNYYNQHNQHLSIEILSNLLKDCTINNPVLASIRQTDERYYSHSAKISDILEEEFKLPQVDKDVENLGPLMIYILSDKEASASILSKLMGLGIIHAEINKIIPLPKPQITTNEDYDDYEEVVSYSPLLLISSDHYSFPKYTHQILLSHTITDILSIVSNEIKDLNLKLAEKEEDLNSLKEQLTQINSEIISKTTEEQITEENKTKKIPQPLKSNTTALLKQLFQDNTCSTAQMNNRRILAQMCQEIIVLNIQLEDIAKDSTEFKKQITTLKQKLKALNQNN